jgi:GNAT superfamily N-acetyltransferase
VISFRSADLPTDLLAIARLIGLTRPEPVTIAQVQEWWHPAPGEVRLTRVAVLNNGSPVGMADTRHDDWLRPGRFRLTLAVTPQWRNQAIGTQLLADGLRFARAQGAAQLEGAVREDAPDALRFAQQRGFRIARHSFESMLDLTDFDMHRFEPILEHARAAGIDFFSLADLRPSTEEIQRKLYELNRLTGLDNPGNEAVFPAYEAFRTAVFEASWYRPDGQIVAAHAGAWIGLAAVAYYPEANYAYNAFTGVRRGFRGRGLAQALKVLAIQWARRQGADYLRTNNDSRNAPMLSINRKLGYQPEPGIYHVQRDLE